jgi:basic amino acid/polyamine antiporter, APA family
MYRTTRIDPEFSSSRINLNVSWNSIAIQSKDIGVQMQENQDLTKIPLKREIGLLSSILLVAGIMIGSGAFKKIAPMSRSLMNGHYILLAWTVAGIITMFGAFTYSGLARLTDKTGGLYEYLRLIYGKLPSFLFGWNVFAIVGSGSIAALAFVFAQSADALFHFPVWLPGWQNYSIGNFIFPFRGLPVKLLAILMIAGLTVLNIRGVRKGSRLNTIVTAAKIGGILLLITSGLLYNGSAVRIIAMRNSLPPLSGMSLFSGFFGAILSASWAYDGWSTITFVTGEIKNPSRNLPLAIVGGVGIAMILYLLLNYIYLKVLPVSQLAAIPDHKIAAAVVAEALVGRAGASLILVLIGICTFGALNACIIAYPRVGFRMAQEKVFFPKAAYVHPQYKTPYISILYTSVWSAVLVLTGTFDILTDLVIFSGYLFFGLAAAGLIKMKRQKKITGPVIGYPVVPLIIVLFSVVLAINTLITQFLASLMGLMLILCGLPFYFLWNKKAEKSGPED